VTARVIDPWKPDDHEKTCTTTWSLNWSPTRRATPAPPS